MKLAIISDIHGNVKFFDECLKAIDGKCVDRIIALGDYFGYMSSGRMILEELRRREAILLKGNHEAMLLGDLPLDGNKDKIYGLRKERETIEKRDRAYLKSLKEEYVLNIDGIKMLFVHGSPTQHLCGYVYENNVQSINSACVNRYNYVFMGHTHRAYIKKSNGVTYVNVGSCGLPRDEGLKPSFCFFDTENKKIEIIRIKIDKEILWDNEYKNLDTVVLDVFYRGVK